MLSMRGLECLVAIVDEGSLTKAAAALHMSQPALSHQLAAIERELGTPVIERLPRGIRPTAAGIVVVAAREHRFAAMDAVPLEELAAEPLVHYDRDNGNALCVDQFAAERGVVLPRPALRTGSPRTAAQLAAGGMGVAIVPVSALTPRPDVTERAGLRAADRGGDVRLIAAAL
jgi:DNA-binding transcriptional LysR family regulator